MNNPGGPPFQGGPHLHQHAPPPHAFRPMPPPPNWLPPGWTEHKAPDGMPYYYNAASGTSSWVKPTLAPPGPPGLAGMGPPGMGPPGMGPPFVQPPHTMPGPPPPGVPNYQQPQLHPPGVVPPPEPSTGAKDGSASKGKKAKKAKKEKAVKKTQILETPWFIVVTSLDNTFFYNKETKTSIWVPTPELEIVLAKMGQVETERLRLEADKAAKEAQGQEMERKRPLDAQESVADKRTKPDDANTGTEMTEDDVAWQLAQMEDMMGGEDQEMASQDEDEDDESDDEAVQARLRLLQGTANNNQTHSQPVSRPTGGMELSEDNIQEREMAFLDIMRDRGVTPFDTWERALAKIEADPRMYLIPEAKARQTLFESYCVIRAQEIKDAKEKESANKGKDKEKDSKEDRKSKDSTASASASSSSSSKPEDVYRRLMEDYTTIKSTWLDFMTKYRTDQRFLGLKPGSLRESIFRAYLSDLKKGVIQPKDKKSSSSSSSRPSSSSSSRHHSSSSSSRKYKATDKEIEEFTSLLKETKKDILYEHKHSSSVEWRKIKKLIDRDRRYDAVGSSTEREQLFREYADRVIQRKD
ncbi:transcription elongation regulator [Podila minutissima]|uniref:Transcription elongation regulator n=1 Tax=Podila minutissima TaxID=64525 RepID=A0A9P5SPC2_9FUNG|nr:transcription elongation regulator [Podila minutissima]